MGSLRTTAGVEVAHSCAIFLCYLVGQLTRGESHICNCPRCHNHQYANNNHLDTHQVKKDKQEFTVKLREGDSFLMPQVFDNDDYDDNDDNDASGL